MEKYSTRIILFCLILGIAFSCSKPNYADDDRLASADGALFDASSAESSTSSGSPIASIDNNGTTIPPGQLTAGEWQDLEEWDFLKELLELEDYDEMESYWSFFPKNRYSIKVTDFYNKPIVDATFQMMSLSGELLWETKTDNFGKAEMWANLYDADPTTAVKILGSFNGMSFAINNPIPYSQGINQVQLPLLTSNASANVDLAFVVDATGSMGDEIEYLKSELQDVIHQVKVGNPNLNIRTGSVFYRDEGDEYVTRESAFTANIETTMEFIGQQRAGGGGDFPEAVHTAVEKGLNLDWSENALTRILFLVLDAPPHYEEGVVTDLQVYIQAAAEQGVKVIPVTASGIDKSTEFLMRFFSMSTNGTYVFITDHSGIGNPHLEPTVGEYEVEFLNELMIRLIKKYSEY